MCIAIGCNLDQRGSSSKFPCLFLRFLLTASLVESNRYDYRAVELICRSDIIENQKSDKKKFAIEKNKNITIPYFSFNNQNT